MSWTAPDDDHLDEVAFIHGHWERALVEGEMPILAFTDGIDERWLAHVEALARAPVAILGSAFAQALEAAGDGAVLALALALLASGDGPAQSQVVSALEIHPRRAPPIVRAMGIFWGDLHGLLTLRLTSAGSPAMAAALLDALAGQGRAPADESLYVSLRSADPALRAAAWRCFPFAMAPRPAWIAAGVADGDPTVREAACEAGVRIAAREALAAARQGVEGRRGTLDFAMIVLAMTGVPRDLVLLQAAAQEPKLRRQAVWALGLSGWVDAIESLLHALADPLVADLAAESIEAALGVRVRSARAASPPEEDADQDEGAVTPRTRWSAPPPPPARTYDVGAAQSSWQRIQGQLPKSGRIFRGAPLTAQGLLSALWREPMRRRHARGLELCARTQGALRAETSTWGWNQLATLRTLSSTLTASAYVDTPLR